MRSGWHWFTPYGSATIGGLAVLAGVILLVLDYATPDSVLRRQVSEALSADLQQLLIREQDSLRQTTFSTPTDAEPGSTLMVEVNRRGEVLRWSSQQYVPSAQALALVLRRPSHGPLADRGQLFYTLVTPTDSSLVLRLIPLLYTYPIRNEYLQDYLFLGRYRWRPEVAQTLRARSSSYGAMPNGIQVTDAQGSVLISLVVESWVPFRLSARLAALMLLGLGLGLLGVVWLRHLQRGRERLPRGWLLALTAALVGLRILMLWLDFPREYVPVSVFSPEVTALDSLSPSLGDLWLNLLLLAWLTHQWLDGRSAQWLHQQGRRLPGWAAAPTGLLWATVGLAAVATYWWGLEQLSLNTKVYLDFTDISQINFLALLQWGCLALGLLALARVLHVASYALRGLTDAHAPTLLAWAVAGALPVLVAWGLLTHDLWVPLLAGMALAWAWALALRARSIQQLNLVPSLVWVAGMAAFTNVSIAHGLHHRTQVSFPYYAERLASTRDPVVEYLFDEVAENIASDPNLWAADSVRQLSDTLITDLINRLTAAYLTTNFKGYDYRVFLYDYYGRRLDAQEDITPTRRPNPAQRQAGATLSERLVHLPDERNPNASVYVGRFTVARTRWGPITLQLELHPGSTTAVGNKLYPQLLVDQSARQPLVVPERYSYALYRNGILQREEGLQDFAARVEDTTHSQTPYWHSTSDYYEYVHPLPEGRVAVLRSSKRPLFDQLTAFSLLFYLYGVLLLGVRGARAAGTSGLLWQPRRWLTSFSFKLQFFMALVAFIPMLALWLLSSSLFTGLYTQGTVLGLEQNLRQVATYVESEGGYLADINSSAPSPSSIALTTRIATLLASDINVYDLRGRQFRTTRTRIFQTGLLSTYMNPQALEALRSGRATQLVHEEQIGRVRYFSGYIPLYDARGTVRGYLNLPYLSQQSVLDGQIRRFAAYLANLFVVLILAIVVGGLFISGSLTTPLSLLRQKMDATTLGQTNEPLAWKSTDEIGAIIRSYNQLLEKLRESERRLARSERETAWREMARQVAHEIKNPLTPMKLTLQQLVRSVTQGQGEKTQVLKASQSVLFQIDSLTRIANSFSEFAAAPSGQPERFQLAPLVNRVVELYAAHPGAGVSAQLPDEEVWVYADTAQLNRVLVNLIGNALHAVEARHANGTPTPGMVQLRVMTRGEHVRIEVEDNGTGMTPEVAQRVFEPHFSTKSSGTGLGLAISKKLIETYHGTMGFTTTWGQGSCFWVELPQRGEGEG